MRVRLESLGCRLNIAELERLADRLRHELEDLDLQAEQQAPAAENSDGEAPHRGPDAAMIARRATLSLSLTDVEGKVREALAEVARTIREMKKYDLAKARREQAKKAQGRQLRQPAGGRLELQLQRRPENV